jgi:hypothetical protein
MTNHTPIRATHTGAYSPPRGYTAASWAKLTSCMTFREVTFLRKTINRERAAARRRVLRVHYRP